MIADNLYIVSKFSMCFCWLLLVTRSGTISTPSSMIDEALTEISFCSQKAPSSKLKGVLKKPLTHSMYQPKTSIQ